MKHSWKWLRSDTGWLIAAGGVFLLSMLHPHPVRITDALTGEPVPDYGVAIDPVRILFEPFVGIPLFFLRGERTLLGFGVLLLYILLGLLIAGVIRSKGRRTGLARAIRLSPLTGGVAVALIWGTVVTPLPSNTLDGAGEDRVIVNTHCHTDRSQDGIVPLNGIMRWHRHNRFDAFFLTEHRDHRAALGSVAAQDRGELDPRPLLLAGEEYWGSNHMTLLGLDEVIPKEELSEREVVESVHRQGGAVIVAHWFEKELKTIPFFMDLGVDGFEVVNQTVGSYDHRVFEQITRACREQDRIMVGAVDNHGYGITCGVWTELDIPGWREMTPEGQREAITSLLRERRSERIRILVYDDRPPQRHISLAALPVFNLFHYFRSLAPLQAASWVFWLLLAALAFRIRNRALFLWTGRGLALSAGLYLVAWGVVYRIRAGALPGNQVYPRYSLLLLAAGLLLMAYVFLLVRWERRKDLLKNI